MRGIPRWFFTPEDMEATRACLDGIDRNVPVKVEPAAAKLLMRNTVCTVVDVLALAEWPAEHLRFVVEPLAAAAGVRMEPMR
jgi:hypothetical protein